MKKSSKELADEILVQNKKDRKRNYSFRLKEDSMDEFQKKAAKLKVSYTDLLQKLIDEFNDGR